MSPEVLILVPLALVELAVLLVAVTVLWCVGSSVMRRRRDRVEAFAVALEARCEQAALEESLDPLDRLQAEYEGGAWPLVGFSFCEIEAASMPHAWRVDGARRCISCKYVTVGGTGE